MPFFVHNQAKPGDRSTPEQWPEQMRVTAMGVYSPAESSESNMEYWDVLDRSNFDSSHDANSDMLAKALDLVLMQPL